MKIANRWFERKQIDEQITLLWEPYVIPLMRCNIWHVRGRDRDLMIDTGMGVVSLKDATKDLIDKPITVAATHAHTDHIGSHHEFDECLVHRLEVDDLRGGYEKASLYLDSPTLTAELTRAGYSCTPGECLLTALPYEGYDLGAYSLKGSNIHRIVDEGDIIDLGDRQFEILHIPGHSPGSIGLWEAKTGILFSGDCVYDGPLLDGFSDSNIDDYIASMIRLRDLPVTVVHAGHDPSFGRERLIELVDGYLELQSHSR